MFPQQEQDQTFLSKQKFKSKQTGKIQYECEYKTFCMMEIKTFGINKRIYKKKGKKK